MNSELSVIANCNQCSSSICQRAYTINLALGYDEEIYCLPCLSKIHEQAIEEFFDTTLHYIKSRECFQKAWNKQINPNSCPLKNNCLFEKCFSESNS